MPPTAPILIMSSERSGSNLLRTLLSNHSGIAGPMAAQLLESFRPHESLFEPLTERTNRVALAEAMLRIANHPLFAWGLDFEPAELIGEHQPQGLIEIIHALYSSMAAKDGARRYVCKENGLFRHADRFLAKLPDTRVLYLHRDPRDYVVSWQRAPILHNTPFEAARAWRDEQRACLEVEQRYGSQVLRLSYEDLVQDTRASMTRALEFLGESVDEACFEVQGHKNEGQRWSVFWRNLTRKVQSDNTAKYRTALDPVELELVETLCVHELEVLGYGAETAQAWLPGPGFAQGNARLSAANDARLRQEHASTVAVIRDRGELLERILQERRRRGAA